MGWSDSFLVIDLRKLLESEDYCKNILNLSKRSKDFKEFFNSTLISHSEFILGLLKQIKSKGIIELNDDCVTSLKFFLIEKIGHQQRPISIEDGSEEDYMFSIIPYLLKEVSNEANKLWAELVRPRTEKKFEVIVNYENEVSFKELPDKVEGNQMSIGFERVSENAKLKFVIKNVMSREEPGSYNIGFLIGEEVKMLKEAFAKIIRNKAKFEQIGKKARHETNLGEIQKANLDEDTFLHYYYRELYIERLFLMLEQTYGNTLFIFKRF